MMARELLGQILKRVTNIDEEKIKEALQTQSEKGGRIGEILIKMGAVTEVDVAKALAIQFGLKFMDSLKPQDVDESMLDKIPISYAKRMEFVILKNGIVADANANDKIFVATSNPNNFLLYSEIQRLFGKPVGFIVSQHSVIISLINTVYGEREVEASDVIGEAEEYFTADLEETKDILDEAGEAPVIRFVNALFHQAIRERSSDIHVEPFEKDVSIRFRVDGVLYDVLKIPKNLQDAVVSRVKVMSRLDIAERRIPQDGKIRLKVAGRDVDVRVSTLPTVYGERVVLRLLDRSSTFLGLEELGMDKRTFSIVEKLIRKSHGIILVTGPTGSGKTTTLYACLDKINSPDQNIITIEDPIEYQLKGINQIHVNPKVGLTFATGLRSILRQDPDIIMVGEIRDGETASIATHASLTGHLVFSTLHTNDAPGAIARLIDMGIEPYLISSSLLAVLAQRLVRKICSVCKEPYEPSDGELLELGLSRGVIRENGGVFWRGRGCRNCMNSGFRGRTGIFELLLVTDGIRALINSSADSNTIRKRAQQEGMIVLKEDGINKILQGVTTPAEVMRVSQEF